MCVRIRIVIFRFIQIETADTDETLVGINIFRFPFGRLFTRRDGPHRCIDVRGIRYSEQTRAHALYCSIDMSHGET